MIIVVALGIVVAWVIYLLTLRRKHDPVTNKVIVVTGGASGIGRLMVERFLLRGARTVHVLDLNPSTAPSDPRVVPHRFDVTDKDAVYKFAKEHGRAVDLVVLNAGIANTGTPIEQEPEARVIKVMEVNYYQHVWFVKAFLPIFRSRSGANYDRTASIPSPDAIPPSPADGGTVHGYGQFVFVASAASLTGAPKLGTYCASKAAAAIFAESVRLELRAQRLDGISCTTVNPFFIRGPSTTLFHGIRQNWFVRLVMPILEDTYVADRIVTAIERCEPLVQMPFMIWLTPLFRLLPPPLVAFAQDTFGLTRAMDTFAGSDAYAAKK
eukprot:TRINITY_DN15030_c0_g1_i1.p1 TRINITY_DN15030_c0_g1~~TRINITY_DN15030_c0_g1_i1.p1  ORF type:complete len:324 (+),score=63.26 TRINITY_DN15030_c0_g1_i1:124-1095(+)